MNGKIKITDLAASCTTMLYLSLNLSLLLKVGCMVNNCFTVLVDEANNKLIQTGSHDLSKMTLQWFYTKIKDIITCLPAISTAVETAQNFKYHYEDFTARFLLNDGSTGYNYFTIGLNCLMKRT